MFLFSLLLLFSPLNLYAQGIISRDAADYPSGSVNEACIESSSSGCIITLPPAKYGESYSFTIPIQPRVLRSDINFVFTQLTACSDGGITFYSNGEILITSATSCKPSVNNFIEFKIKAVSSDLTDSVKCYLPILRDPIKIVLVLDMSGSMALPVPGGSLSRWQALKNSVELFTQKLEVFKQDGDYIGVTYFSTDVIQPESPIQSGFIPISAATDPTRSSAIIRVDMSGKEPTLKTAMGKGLLDAKLKLNENNPIHARKLVLLFTDGLQNVEPLVNPDGVSLSTAASMLNSGPCDAIDSIRYYTIGMGSTTLAPETLGQIAQSSGGISLSTTTGSEDDDIDYFFQNQLANMLGKSPQVVSRKTGVLSTSGVTYSYPINGNVSTLYFELITPDAANVTLKLDKDGKDLTPYAKLINGSFYKSLSLSLPVMIPELMKTEGIWNLTLSGSSTSKYSVVCYVDDHFLDFSCQPAKSVYTVGDHLYLKAKVSFAGQPLSGDAAKVQVMLLKPGDDAGDLLTRIKDKRNDSINDVDPGAEAMYLRLIQNDKSFCKKLVPENHIIDLKDDGKGQFNGEYKNTELSGVYQLIFFVNGEIPGYGKFERQKQYSTVFKFGQISSRTTHINAKISSKSSDKSINSATITVKPKNKFGHYLGQGFLSRIKVSVDSYQGVISSSKDNLDGSYTFTIGNIPQNIKPDVRIVVMGETLYLGKFPTPRVSFWQYFILVLLIIILIFLYIQGHTVQTLFRNLVWVLVILWILFLILQKIGIIVF